jgi:hypothetical protein
MPFYPTVGSNALKLCILSAPVASHDTTRESLKFPTCFFALKTLLCFPTHTWVPFLLPACSLMYCPPNQNCIPLHPHAFSLSAFSRGFSTCPSFLMSEGTHGVDLGTANGYYVVPLDDSFYSPSPPSMISFIEGDWLSNYQSFFINSFPLRSGKMEITYYFKK